MTPWREDRCCLQTELTGRLRLQIMGRDATRAIVPERVRHFGVHLPIVKELEKNRGRTGGPIGHQSILRDVFTPLPAVPGISAFAITSSDCIEDEQRLASVESTAFGSSEQCGTDPLPSDASGNLSTAPKAFVPRADGSHGKTTYASLDTHGDRGVAPVPVVSLALDSSGNDEET